MADLTSNFIGIKSPNPFWLASAPPTDKEYNVRRAFDAGWGGVVWKTLGSEGPPIVNVSGPRYGAIWGADRRLLGLNNIELITDRPLQVNLEEIRRVKRDYPDRAVVISLMVPCDEDSWKDILHRIEDTGADGVELNFGCPHGMSERGMGAAVGQVPEYCQMITEWVMEKTRVPVLVKLTPNITDTIRAKVIQVFILISGRRCSQSLKPNRNCSTIGITIIRIGKSPGSRGSRPGSAGSGMTPAA